MLCCPASLPKRSRLRSFAIFSVALRTKGIAPSGLCEPTAYDNSTAEKIIVGAIKTDADGLVRAEKFVFTIENGVVTDVEGED